MWRCLSGVEAAFQAEDLSMYGEKERDIRGIPTSVLRRCGGVFLSFVCREQHLNLPENLSDIVGGMGDFFSKDYLLSPERIRKKEAIR